MNPDPSSRFVIQKATAVRGLPPKKNFLQWLGTALPTFAEVTVRLIDEEEAMALNQSFRGKSYAPNVLAFPLDETPDGFLFGDIVICAPIVFQEAKKFGVHPHFRFAHLLIHGALHLLGYDHEKEEDACLMETKEAIILNQLGFPNPYDDEASIDLA